MDDALRPRDIYLDVLLVEDSVSDTLYTKHLIEGYHEEYPEVRVIAVTNIKSAIEHIHTKCFDIILLDLFLPDAKELEGVQTLIALCPRIAVIVYSGAYSYEMARKVIAAGAQEFLVKGVADKNDLLRAIANSKHRQNIINDLRNTDQISPHEK